VQCDEMDDMYDYHAQMNVHHDDVLNVRTLQAQIN